MAQAVQIPTTLPDQPACPAWCEGAHPDPDVDGYVSHTSPTRVVDVLATGRADGGSVAVELCQWRDDTDHVAPYLHLAIDEGGIDGWLHLSATQASRLATALLEGANAALPAEHLCALPPGMEWVAGIGGEGI